MGRGIRQHIVGKVVLWVSFPKKEFGCFKRRCGGTREGDPDLGGPWGSPGLTETLAKPKGKGVAGPGPTGVSGSLVHFARAIICLSHEPRRADSTYLQRIFGCDPKRPRSANGGAQLTLNIVVCGLGTGILTLPWSLAGCNLGRVGFGFSSFSPFFFRVFGLAGAGFGLGALEFLLVLVSGGGRVARD